MTEGKKSGFFEEQRIVPDQILEGYEDYERWKGPIFGKLQNLSSEEIIRTLRNANLRGRGGAGFPMNVKWAGLAGHSCPKRFVVCNSAEGEPGTFKDRFLLRRNPYSTLEGMIIAARTIGAKDLFIAMKTSFAKEYHRVRSAYEEMRNLGFFKGLNLTIVRGPEEYLFGEEKALLNVIEGGAPCPREAHYPPYEVGLFATGLSPNPALVNNVETYARVSMAIRFGSESFRSLGTEDTPGLLIFTVSGDVKYHGVFELEAGITLRELLDRYAGGPAAGQHYRAALSGVASKIIVEKDFDTPLDFSSMKAIGSGLGSAGFIVIGDKTDMARVAQSVARFLHVESCNQCPSCKHGLGVAAQGLDSFFGNKHFTQRDIEQTLWGARSAPQGNRCFLPTQGARVIPSIMENFKSDFSLEKRSSHSSSPYIIPKLVDYDEQARRFIYDVKQWAKSPNW